MFSKFASNVSTSTAATGPSFGSTMTSAGMFGNINSGLGFTYSGVDGATSTLLAPPSMIITTTAGFTYGLQSPTSIGINNTVPFGSYGSGAVTSTVNSINTPMMSYTQLESIRNKWSLELQEQEKHFSQLASQIITLDRAVTENCERVNILHEEVEKAKQQQERLEQELNLVSSQLMDLDALLNPLEEVLKAHSRPVCPVHGGDELERIYRLAETIDAKMKRMAQDLMEVTEPLNMFGRPADTNEPLQQLRRILNFHLESLQWINNTSGILQRKIDDFQRAVLARSQDAIQGLLD